MTLGATEMTAELFESLEGEALWVHSDCELLRYIELRVAGVRRLPPHSRACRTPFAVDLTGSAEAPLGQGTYEFRHESFGTELIFIVPVAQDHAVRRYEAIFN